MISIHKKSQIFLKSLKILIVAINECISPILHILHLVLIFFILYVYPVIIDNEIHADSFLLLYH